jgi:hypothetical protein
MVERSRRAIEQVHEEDREEIINLNQAIETAVAAKDELKLGDATKQLAELLFFVAARCVGPVFAGLPSVLAAVLISLA